MFLFVWKLKTVFFKYCFLQPALFSLATSIFLRKTGETENIKALCCFPLSAVGSEKCESWEGEGGGRGRIDPLTIIDSHLPHNFAITFTPTPHTIFSTDSVLLFVRASDCREVASDWLYRRWQQKGKYKILLIY